MRSKTSRSKRRAQASDYEVLANAIMHPKSRITPKTRSMRISVELLRWLVTRCERLSKAAGRIESVPPALREEWQDITRMLNQASEQEKGR